MNKFLATLKKVTENKILNFLLLVIASICTGILSLYFAASSYGMPMFKSYFSFSWIIVLNILPVVWLTLFLWFATRRAALSYGITAILVMIFTFINWYKLQFRNDPLLFEDIFLVREAGNMTSNYKLFFPKRMIIAIILILLGIVVLFFMARAKLKRNTRLIGSTILLLFLFPMFLFYTSSNIYSNKTANYKLINRWGSTQNYVCRGFVYPFLYSVHQASEPSPTDYDA